MTQPDPFAVAMQALSKSAAQSREELRDAMDALCDLWGLYGPDEGWQDSYENEPVGDVIRRFTAFMARRG